MSTTDEELANVLFETLRAQAKEDGGYVHDGRRLAGGVLVGPPRMGWVVVDGTFDLVGVAKAVQAALKADKPTSSPPRVGSAGAMGVQS